MNELKKQFKRNENSESQFLTHITREMKTSLDGIMGFAHLLSSQRPGKLNEKQSRYVSEIYESGKQLRSLVSDYIDLARIDSGTLDLNFSQLDVKEYILWVLDILQPRMNDKNLNFTVVWKTPCEKIQGDATRFKQILYILLSKAVEFALEGERMLLNVEFDQTFLKIHLKNDCSIERNIESPEPARCSTREDVFDPDLIGFNFSLALAQKLIQLHGGDIGLEYEENGGSSLWFTISKNKNPQAIDDEPRVESHAVGQKKSLRILLVDDSNNIQNLVAEILKKENYIVFVADDGQAGLELAQRCRPDLILMDINMPVMDGTETIRKLRADSQFVKTPVVALTAYDMEESRRDLLNLGFDHYLNKPFSKSDLLNALQACVSPAKPNSH